MRQWICLTLVVLTHTYFVSPLLAWNDAGHQTIARIAWIKLSDAERHTINAMLRELRGER